MIYRNQWLIQDSTINQNTELKDAKMMVLELFFMKT